MTDHTVREIFNPWVVLKLWDSGRDAAGCDKGRSLLAWDAIYQLLLLLNRLKGAMTQIDRPVRMKRRVYTDLSHLRQRQPRHLRQAAAANLSHCNCNSTTEVIRPVSPLFFSFSPVHSSCPGFFTFFHSRRRCYGRTIATTIRNFTHYRCTC